MNHKRASILTLILMSCGLILYFPPVFANPMINNTSSAQSSSTTLTIANSGDVIVLCYTLYDTASDAAITGIAGTKGDASYTLQVASGVQSLYNLYIYSYQYTSIATSTGSDTITVSETGTLITPFITAYDITGISATASASNYAIAAQGSGTPATASTSYLSTNILIGCENSAYGISLGSNPVITAGSGFTLIQPGGYTYQGSEYEITSGSGSTTFPFTTNSNTGYALTGAVYTSNQSPNLLNLIVSPSTPDGGAIYIQNTLTTVTATTTITNNALTTITLTAQAFATYIFFGWAGDTALLQNTIDPTQTITLSVTLTTISNTLTALFSTGGGATTTIINSTTINTTNNITNTTVNSTTSIVQNIVQNITDDSGLTIIALLFILMVFLSLKRRKSK